MCAMLLRLKKCGRQSIKSFSITHSLMNYLLAKISIRRLCHGESVLQFSNRIRQISSTLKSMKFMIPESEMAMALVNGLPDDYNALISALDAIDEDETKLKF